jgi:hypothetical protein
VIIYESPTTDHVRRIHHVVEATTPRFTFEGGMREVAWEALALLWHEVQEQIEHSQYHHFLSCAQEGVEAVVMPVGDRDHIGCFADQVKLTCALVWDLDETVKEVKLLGEHEEESSKKITELETLCKRLREDAQKLQEEKATLKGMIQSCDELIVEMAEEYGLNLMGENDDNEDENDDDEGNTTAPLHLRHLLLHLRRSSKKKPPWRWFLRKRPLWRMRWFWQMQSLSHCNPASSTWSWGIMRRARRGWRMVRISWMTWMIWMMTQMKFALTCMSGFLKMGVMIEIGSLSLSL